MEFVGDKSVGFLEAGAKHSRRPRARRENSPHRLSRADLTVSCTSPTWYRLEAVAIIGMIVYPIGVNVLYAALLWRSRDSIQHRDGAGAEHLSFLYRNYSPEYLAWDIVDNIRRIALTGFIVLVSEKSRSSVATILAIFFYGLHENAKPFHRDENNLVASISNAMLALIFLLLTILQGRLMPKAVVASCCAVLSCVVLPIVLAFQLIRIKRRADMMATLENKVNDSEEQSYVTTAVFRETFSQIWAAGPCAQQELREKVMGRFDFELSQNPINEESWDECIALLRTIAPFNESSAEHEKVCHHRSQVFTLF